MARRLFAYGKSTVTPDGTRATLMEMRGRRPIADRTIAELTSRGAVPDDHNEDGSE